MAVTTIGIGSQRAADRRPGPAHRRRRRRRRRAVPGRPARLPRVRPGDHPRPPGQRLGRCVRGAPGRARRPPLPAVRRPGRQRRHLPGALRGTFWIGDLHHRCRSRSASAAAVYLEEYAPRSWFTHFINVNIRNLAGRAVGRVRHPRPHDPRRRTWRRSPGASTVIAAGITISPARAADRDHHVGRGRPGRARRRCARGRSGSAPPAGRSSARRCSPTPPPGILTGTVLALARALGEAAPLLLVGAVGERLVDGDGFFDPASSTSFTALPIAITDWTKRPLNSGFTELAAATIIVMLVIVFICQRRRHHPPQPLREEEGLNPVTEVSNDAMSDSPESTPPVDPDLDVHPHVGPARRVGGQPGRVRCQGPLGLLRRLPGGAGRRPRGPPARGHRVHRPVRAAARPPCCGASTA